MDALLGLQLPSVIEAQNSGLFISPGKWMHTTRQIDTFELILVHEGILKLFEKDKKFNVNPREMLLLFPGRIHGGTELYCDKLSFSWLHFKIRKTAMSNNSYHIELPQHIIPANPHRLNMLFRQYLNDQSQGILTALKAELLILQILDEASKESRITAASNIIAEQVFRFISEHYSESISTASIAHEIQHNSDYIGRCFKKAYDYTITEEINRRRLLEAEKLLIDKNIKLNEIATQCGFNSPSYFSKLFVRKNDITPNNFRKNLSRIHINTY